MSKFKLTKAGRAVIGVVLAAAVAFGCVGGIKSGLIKFDKKNPGTVKPATQVSTSKPTTDDNTINVSLDEWAG